MRYVRWSLGKKRCKCPSRDFRPVFSPTPRDEFSMTKNHVLEGIRRGGGRRGLYSKQTLSVVGLELVVRVGAGGVEVAPSYFISTQPLPEVRRSLRGPFPFSTSNPTPELGCVTIVGNEATRLEVTPSSFTWSPPPQR